MEKPQKVDIVNLIEEHLEQQQQWEESIDPHKLGIGKVIGSGSYSVVRRGSYHDQVVALKLFDFGDMAITKRSTEIMKYKFVKEITLWRILDHPNITKMIGATMSMKSRTGCMNKRSTTLSNFCIVSEYLKGGSLRAYLMKNRKKKLCMQSVIRFALDIARGLVYLHSKKIFHLDVKPENILIGKEQTVKLADFGESMFEEELSLMCDEIGTRGYMAPEVFSNREYGPKCDVFSFGIVLWEIYCCDMAYPYNLDNVPEFVFNYMRPNIPLNCPTSLARLMEQCWDTDPKKRPEMTYVVDKLEEIATSEEWQTISKDKKSPHMFWVLQAWNIGCM